MEYRSLNITVISAEAIKNVKLFSKMNVYAVVELQGYPRSKKKTIVDKDCGTHPKWNHRMEFVIDEPYLTIPALSLVFTLKAETSLGGDTTIGTVIVPVHDLYNNNLSTSSNASEEKFVEYQVCTPKNRAKGTLKFSYHFGEKFTQQVDNNINQANQQVVPYPFNAGGVYPTPPPTNDPVYPPLTPPQAHAPYPPPVLSPPPRAPAPCTPPSGYGYSPPPGYVQSTMSGYSHQPMPSGYGQSTMPGYSQPTPAGHGQAPSPGYGYQAPSPGYGYQAPQPGYGYQAPTNGYGYQAPTNGYGYRAPSPQVYVPSPNSSSSSTTKKTKKNKRKGDGQ